MTWDLVVQLLALTTVMASLMTMASIVLGWD